MHVLYMYKFDSRCDFKPIFMKFLWFNVGSLENESYRFQEKITPLLFRLTGRRINVLPKSIFDFLLPKKKISKTLFVILKIIFIVAV